MNGQFVTFLPYRKPTPVQLYHSTSPPSQPTSHETTAVSHEHTLPPHCLTPLFHDINTAIIQWARPAPRPGSRYLRRGRVRLHVHAHVARLPQTSPRGEVSIGKCGASTTLWLARHRTANLKIIRVRRRARKAGGYQSRIFDSPSEKSSVRFNLAPGRYRGCSSRLA